MDDFDLDVEIKETIPPDIRPTLYDINKSLDVLKTDRYDGVKGEEEARMVIFTNFILGEKPVILKGSRASGKTTIMETVGAFARNPVIFAASSEKGHIRDKGLNRASHFIVPEINKVNEQDIDMLKDFGEGAAHQYTFTNSYKESEVIKIDPKPFATSIADENKNVNALGEELLSRLTVVRTDSSVKQNMAVIDEKLLRAADPFYKKGISQDKVKKYIDYVKSLPTIRSFSFVYPAGTAMKVAIPPLFTDSRRDTDKYLANTYAITLFHYYERMRVTIGDKSYLLVTPIDMWYNHIIYQNILLESSLKCGRIEKEILDILKAARDDVVTDNWGNQVKGQKIGDIHTELLKRSYTPTIDSVNKYCTQLMEVGYLIRNEEVRPYRFSLNPELKREYSVDINWEDIIEACKANISRILPDVADEYISRFCEGEGLVGIHPFTGKKINIIEWKDSSPPVTKDEPKKELVKPKVKNTQLEMSTLTSEVPISVNVPSDLDLEGITDENDHIEYNILSVLNDGEKHTVEELLKFGDEKSVMGVVAFLLKTQAIIKDGADSYRVLR